MSDLEDAVREVLDASLQCNGGRQRVICLTGNIRVARDLAARIERYGKTMFEAGIAEYLPPFGDPSKDQALTAFKGET